MFTRFDTALIDRGYLAMALRQAQDQIVDATLVPAPKQIPWAGWRSEFLQNEVVITTQS